MAELKDFAQKIEKKWQDRWERDACFRAANPGEPGSELPKFYCLDMFPYPSGQGLHVGHPLGYLATDILCRFKRMQGFNVLHPMGWDAFGLPAEQYAIQTGIHPEITTAKNIETYKRQLRMLGLGYDWSREVSTADPRYYKWTQWIFKKLYEKGLAYEDEVAVNWCPALGTVLANDEIIDGKSERGGHPVERRPMRQWMLRITAYAERLLNDLDLVDYPESTKDHQRNWIGRSEGAEIRFPLSESSADVLEVFTTRPDTLMGVTFMVLAPEHPLVEKLLSSSQRDVVKAYQLEAARKSDLQRGELDKEKTGVSTGGFVLHPITKEKIPVWVADYVLMNYGTGAIMAVPAHDERDQAFAEKFGIAIKQVISEDGRMMQSDQEGLKLEGRPAKEGARLIVEFLQSKGLGESKITYRLRDWIFSRQRYWGEPIPVLHKKNGKGTQLIEDKDLPLTLPKVERYEPSGTGESPLVTVRDWIEIQDPVTGEAWLRESNTMPGSAGSSWYFLRYMDAQNDQEAWSTEAEKYWQQVDLYLGGAEHAVGHLLYSRFWHKVFFDLGLVSNPEPYKRLVHQGYILGENHEKMSKSRGNVINPDDVVSRYGADTFRVYEMFMGPIEKAKPWSTGGIEGVYRFLSKFYRAAIDESGALKTTFSAEPEAKWPKDFRHLYHKTIKQVAGDIESLSFNTAISAMMILLNDALQKFADGALPREFIKSFTLLLAPFAPHMSEEIWELLGNKNSITKEKWPTFDPALCIADVQTLGIQVNGKLRDSIEVPLTITEEEIRTLVLSREAVQKWMESKPLKKFVYVKGRIVSVVV